MTVPEQPPADRRGTGQDPDDIATTQVSREAWSRQIPEQDPRPAPAAPAAPSGVPAGPTDGTTGTERTTDDAPATRAYRPVDDDEPIDAPRAGSTQAAGGGETAAYQPFRSGPQPTSGAAGAAGTSVPSSAPFPADRDRADSSSSTGTDSGGPRGGDRGGEATTVLPAGTTRRDEERAFSSSGDGAGPDRTAAYPGVQQSGPAQPAYVPPTYGDERNSFLGQQSREDEVVLAPERSRIWQNLAGALAGLVLVLGPIVGFALLAGTPDSLFDQETGRRLLLLGMIAVAAAPALLAGWAPAAAWFPGAIVLVLGGIAWFSGSFTQTLGSWSDRLFGTTVVGQFVATTGVFLGFALVFAGLGAAWARSSGRDGVISRMRPKTATPA